MNSRYFAYDNQQTIVRKGMRFGVLNETTDLIIPPVYDYVRKVYSSYFMFQNGRWSIYANGKISETSFDAISNRHYPKGFVVFNENKISLLDIDLNTIVPYSTYDEAMDMDWPNLLEWKTAQLMSLEDADSLYVISKEDSLYMNFQIWRMLDEGSTKNLFSTLRTYKKKRNKPKYQVLFEDYKHIEKTIHTRLLYHDNKYYSQKLTIPKTYWTGSYSYKGVGKEYVTQRVEDGKIFECSLRDLIVPGTEGKLDTLMMEELNRLQVYGDRCVDLMDEIGELKSRFSLGQFGVEFHEVGRYVDSIIIPYYLLEGVLEF